MLCAFPGPSGIQLHLLCALPGRRHMPQGGLERIRQARQLYPGSGFLRPLVIDARVCRPGGGGILQGSIALRLLLGFTGEMLLVGLAYDGCVVVSATKLRCAKH